MPQALSKFLTYWSLTFAILVIWIFSIAVAFADVKDEFLGKLQKQWAARAKAGNRPRDPLAGRAVGETLQPPAMTETQAWVFDLVSQIATSLKLDVKIIVLQDSMEHYLVHFTRGPRLVSYRVDKAWVADARAGKADQQERIRTAVAQYLRQEFLGEKMAPKPAAAAPARTPATAAPGQKPAATSPGQAAAAPSGAPAPATTSGTEMSREERIAAAKARAEAARAQRASEGPASPGEDRPARPAPASDQTVSSGDDSGATGQPPSDDRP